MKKILYLLLSLSTINQSTFAFVFYEDTKIWNQDSITFHFLDGTEQQKAEVKKFAKLWQRYTGIKFIYSNSKPGFFNFKKYYKITFKGSSNESTRGAINGILHLGNLSDNIIFRKTTVLHEFGHMLGLGHEHQRLDRPISLNNKDLISSCIKNQHQSIQWCKENLNNINRDEVFIESEYDSQSIMHYRLNNITDNEQLLDGLPESNFNTLSFTDKYYVAMLYNQHISDTTLENMHKQDLWNQNKFEISANKAREKAISELATSSCKTLKYHSQSKDGKFCENGFMIIGTDGLSFPDDEFRTCYTSFKDIKEKINKHQYCHLNADQLSKKRQFWSNQFAQFGNCKRLETNERNKQEYFCKEGYSFVTFDNNMVGKTTQCFSSQESAYNAMLESKVCNMSQSDFKIHQHLTEQSLIKQMKTRYCQVVKKDYNRFNCPLNFEYSIIKNNSKNKPLENKCFGSKFQAINAMQSMAICQS